MMNLADVKANECISLYKPISSEDISYDRHARKKITFYKSFCIRTLTMVILYIRMLGFLISRKVKHSYIFFKCMSIENNYVNMRNVLCAFYLGLSK